MRCILKPSIRIRRFVLFRDQPLIDYFKKYRTQHGLLQRADPNQCHSESTINVRQEIRHDSQKADFVHWGEITIKAGPAKLRFFRTLRAPDDVDEYLLPPVGIV